VWGTGAFANVVSGMFSDGEDNIVWATLALEEDNIVWGTLDEDNIVWGTSQDRVSAVSLVGGSL
jgi:hypothetical protein